MISVFLLFWHFRTNTLPGWGSQWTKPWMKIISLYILPRFSEICWKTHCKRKFFCRTKLKDLSTYKKTNKNNHTICCSHSLLHPLCCMLKYGSQTLNIFLNQGSIWLAHLPHSQVLGLNPSSDFSAWSWQPPPACVNFLCKWWFPTHS